MLLAKVALSCCVALGMAAAYTFHEGILQVHVDEARANGHHVHIWLPAAVVPIGIHFVPRQYLSRASEQAAPWLPTIEAFANELERYPQADLVDVRNANEHVRVHTLNGKLLVDVDARDENVHVQCPLTTLAHISRELHQNAPTI
jgi:hypothetical protein